MLYYSLHFILLFLCFWLDPDSAEGLHREREKDRLFFQLESWLHYLGHDSLNEAPAKRLDQCIMALTFSG